MSTEINSKFYELSQDSIDSIDKIFDKLALPFNLKKKYVGNSKQKCLIKLQKVSDINVFLSGVELVVFLNEDYLTALEDDSSTILIHQALDCLQFDISKGTFKIAKPALQTTEGVLKKYGIEAVAKANQLNDLVKKQKDDEKKEKNAIGFKTGSNKAKKSVEFN